MLRKILIVLAAAALSAAPAFAADWSGGYIGVFASDQSGDDTLHSDESGTQTIVEVSGTGYGFLVGYNHQDGNFVVGTEFEYGLGSADGFLPSADPGNNFGYDITSELGSTMRLRARFGYAFGDFLPYFAAGLSSTTSTYAADLQGYIDVNRLGFSTGVGLDWQMSDTWSFRAEYLTEDFSSAVYNDYCYVCDTWDSNLSQDTMRLGASMKF